MAAPSTGVAEWSGNALHGCQFVGAEPIALIRPAMARNEHARAIDHLHGAGFLKPRMRLRQDNYLCVDGHAATSTGRPAAARWTSQSQACCAFDAAVKMARLSAFRTRNHD